MLKICFFLNNYFNYQNSYTNPSQGSRPKGTLLCDIKIKSLFQKELPKNPSFQTCLLFSSIFNQSVLPAAELDSNLFLATGV